jgi:CRISPR/Cas system Type II protein with McrA/HNH and RuvC-like nuclease domain
MLFFDERPGRRKTSADDKQDLYRKQKGRCMYCGRKLSIHYFHVDHKNPLNRKGIQEAHTI